MFSINKINEHEFEEIILKDNDLNTTATVLPGCGAILHAFTYTANGYAVNVIESYDTKEDFIHNAESKGFRGCKLSPFVCRLHKGAYEFAGENYKTQGFYLDDNAIHGLLHKKSFVTTSYAANENCATATMKYEYRMDDAGYPFNYDCIVTWQLEKNNLLSVTTECINKCEKLIPMQDGWHPYFNLGSSVNELQLEFQSKEMVEFNSGLLPTKNLIQYNDFNFLKSIGNTSFDNCFTLDQDERQPSCVLLNPIKKIGIEIYPEKSYPYLQIYIPPGRNSIAIENLSGAPDAFNNNMGFITLEPGCSAHFKTAYKSIILK